MWQFKKSWVCQGKKRTNYTCKSWDDGVVVLLLQVPSVRPYGLKEGANVLSGSFHILKNLTWILKSCKTRPCPVNYFQKRKCVSTLIFKFIIILYEHRFTKVDTYCCLRLLQCRSRLQDWDTH